MQARCRLEIQQNRPEQYFTNEEVESGDINQFYQRARQPMSTFSMTFWLDEEDLPPLPAMNFMVGVAEDYKKDLTIVLPRGDEMHAFRITGAWIKNAQYSDIGASDELGVLEVEMIADSVTLLETIKKRDYDPNKPIKEPPAEPKEPKLPDNPTPPYRILDI